MATATELAAKPRNRGKSLAEMGWRPRTGLTTSARLGKHEFTRHDQERAVVQYARWLARRDGIELPHVAPELDGIRAVEWNGVRIDIPNWDADLSRVEVEMDGGGIDDPKSATAYSRRPDAEGRSLHDLGWKPRNVRLTPISRLGGPPTSRWKCRATRATGL